MSARTAPTSLEVSVKAGRIEIRSTAVEVPTVVKGPAHFDEHGVLHCKASASVLIECPAGTDLMIGTLSGSVTCTGEFGAVSVTTMSGRVRVGACRSADIRTLSGSVVVGPVAEQCRVKTESARVEVLAARRCDVSSKSGRVSVGAVQDCTVHSASGRAEVACTSPGEVEIHTISGTIELTYPPTFSPQVTISRGRVSNRLKPGVPLRGTALVASTAGNIRLHNA